MGVELKLGAMNRGTGRRANYRERQPYKGKNERQVELNEVSY
jgi:hypothetical protein